MSDVLRNAMSQIEIDRPLSMPVHVNVAHFSPRLDRLEGKVDYLVEYIAFLEQRIMVLESEHSKA